MAWQKHYLSCIAGWALTSTQEEMKEGRAVCLEEVLAMWWRTICHQQSSLNWALSCTTHSMRTSPDLNGSAGQSQEETWLKICMKRNANPSLFYFGHNLTTEESLVYKHWTLLSQSHSVSRNKTHFNRSWCFTWRWRTCRGAAFVSWHNKWPWFRFQQKQGLLFNSTSFTRWVMNPR